MKLITAALFAALVPFVLPTSELAAGPDPCKGCKMSLQAVTTNNDLNVQLLTIPGTSDSTNGKCVWSNNACGETDPCNIKFHFAVTPGTAFSDLQGELYDDTGTLIQPPTNLPETGGETGYVMFLAGESMQCEGPDADFITIKITHAPGGNRATLAEYKVYCSLCEKS
ncbi:MAG: hypothetical protein KDC95_08565 [Planctomycetes bacterium]|nr:hypothetical protein [Planctomycetota bacterium]